MYKDLDGTHYDFMVFGTSATESIFSSHLAKCGKKIIHFENSRNYGGDTKTFNFKDLDLFLCDLKNNSISDPYMTGLSLIEGTEKFKEGFFQTEKLRDYNIDLNTKFIYSKSISTSSLADSNASNYMEFHAIKRIRLLNDGQFFDVPSTKSEIFNSKFLNLEEKQKLLNYIYSTIKIVNSEVDVNATIDFGKDIEVDNKYIDIVRKYLKLPHMEFFNFQSFTHKLQMIIKSVLGNINDENMSLYGVMERTYKYISSLQVYDDSPYLYPLYGSSEFSQALCRMASVYGTIFIVNECLKFVFSEKDSKLIVEVTDTKENEKFTVSSDFLIINEVYLSSKNIKYDFIKENRFFFEMKSQAKEYKHTYFFIIEMPEDSKRIEGPNFYIIPSLNPLYQNQTTIIINEFCLNSYSTPKNRSLFKIDLISNTSDPSPLIKIFEIFVENHLKQNEGAKIIYQIAFNQEIFQSEYSFTHNNNVIVTCNNYSSYDLDFYYKQYDRLIKQHESLNKLTEMQYQGAMNPNFEKEDHHDDLINELFNEFQIDK